MTVSYFGSTQSVHMRMRVVCGGVAIQHMRVVCGGVAIQHMRVVCGRVAIQHVLYQVTKPTMFTPTLHSEGLV